MTGEQEPIAAIEPEEEPAIVGQEEPEPTEPEGQEQGNPEGDPPQQEETEELETIDVDGKQYQVPKAVKAGIMMQADYTRKTQEVAAQRRELEGRAQQIAQQAQASEEEMTARATLIGVNQAIQQYANVNWDQLEQEDPIAAQTHWRRYQTLQDQQRKISTDLFVRQNERTQQAKQETAKRLEETRAYAEKNIKGWTPELDVKMTEFAVNELGFDRVELGNATNPQVYRALYLAWLGQQALSKQAKPVASATPPTPLKTVGAKASPAANKSLADMSMEEYVAYRRNGKG
jgi:hypothetical protein